MNNPTVEQVARIFGATEAQVRSQYGLNSVQLRGMAHLAGGGKYRGKTAQQWDDLAAMAEQKSKIK